MPNVILLPMKISIADPLVIIIYLQNTHRLWGWKITAQILSVYAAEANVEYTK